MAVRQSTIGWFRIERGDGRAIGLTWAKVHATGAEGAGEDWMRVTVVAARGD